MAKKNEQTNTAKKELPQSSSRELIRQSDYWQAVANTALAKLGL